MEKFTLTDLISVEALQAIQDAFSRLTGMTAVIIDADGNAVTKGPYDTDFCLHHVRETAKGIQCCADSDRYGTEMALSAGKVVTYTCHAGLIDFAAPIVAHGELVGSIIGGQVLEDKPDFDYFREVANNLGSSDVDAFCEAVKRVPVRKREDIDRAAEFVSMMANTLSEMAYSKYNAIEMNEEIEKAANAKTDFLANMSHEIRTPMNAVIGLAEMALREDLPTAARDYITQIKSSGRALLLIINDILDFSKIDSGKMELQPMEYELLSMLNDTANIVMTRLRDKYGVELQLQISPDIPSRLYGDNLRIRQVLINLANNAVKFTNRGRVLIRVDHEVIDDETINLRIAVEDTGIGIKEKDIKKLFQSFQQVDSKRNRNVEGTGLGLAISKNLVELMGGSVHVESEYEKGSIFSFEVPQRIVDAAPIINIKDRDNLAVIGFFNNRYIAKQFYEDLKKLDVYSMALVAPDRFDNILKSYFRELRGKKLYIFAEEESYDEIVNSVIMQYPEISGIMLSAYNSDLASNIKNLRIINKPFSTISLAMALNEEEFHASDADQHVDFDFTAPDAQVLIVDDNTINLTVAEGLLEPLKMKIFSASSGQMALDMLEDYKFDLIFMDHMMPELDGVETTRIIRRLHPELNDVPIIALTANAVAGTKEMFISEGMNDFVAKPIEVGKLVSTVKKWLPKTKILKISRITKIEDTQTTKAEEIVIGDLDIALARKMLGSEKLFFGILKEYYRTIKTKHDAILKHYEDGNWELYTIEVHALKSASKQIGAVDLSSLAANLEAAGHERNITKIQIGTEDMLKKYISYIDVLKPFCEEEEKKAEPQSGADPEVLKSLLNEMDSAIDNLDMDQMEAVITDMSAFAYDEQQQALFDNLKVAVDNIDVDAGAEIVANWRDIING